MRDVAQRTWLPTLLFCSVILAIELTSIPNPSPPAGTLTGMTLIVVPLPWWLIVRAHRPLSMRRAITAGSICGMAIVIVALLIAIVSTASKGRVDHSGDAAMAVGVLFLMIAAVVMVSIGAVIGVIAMLLERVWGRRGARELPPTYDRK